MAKELSKKYIVSVFTFTEGLMARKIKEFVEVTTEMPDGDFYLVNHTNCFSLVPKNKPIIFTSHGRFGLELFPKEDCLKVGVTEETAQGNMVIRNGVDCERFKSKKPINKKLTNILYLSNPSYGKAGDMIREACRGYNLITLDTQRFNIENLINEADLVITLGRGILESLACERNVISADWRDGWMSGVIGAGMITEDNFDRLKTHAFSGRNNPIEFTAESLRKELDKYNPENNLRPRILEEFNIKKQCQKYTTLFNLDT